MSKIKPASCVSNVVKIGSFPVDATVLSQGVAPSSGLALIEEDNVTYITSNASDIHDVIAQVTNLIQLVSDTLTAIGSGMTGPTTAPPATLPTSIVNLATIKSTLSVMKDNLK